MPYIYAHALTGFYALQNCKNIAQVVKPPHIDAFFLGTMGPDPYFGDAYPPPLGGRAQTGLADRLHALDGRTLFDRLLAHSRGSDMRLAYTAGFLCHFLLDNRVHPYIEARYPGPAHTPAEIAMDPLLVARENERRLTVSPAAFYHTGDVADIDALHAALFSELFSLDTGGLYARSLKKWLRLNALLYDPAGRKRAVTCAFPALSQYFIAPRPRDEQALLNLANEPWSPNCARTGSVPALLHAAEAEICHVIGLLAAGQREAALSALAGRNADAA